MRGIGDGRAVIAARRGDDARRRHLARQEIGEGAARLERAGVLQKLKLERQPPEGKPEIARLDRQDRRPPHMRADQRRRRADGVVADRRVVFRKHAEHSGVNRCLPQSVAYRSRGLGP